MREIKFRFWGPMNGYNNETSRYGSSIATLDEIFYWRDHEPDDISCIEQYTGLKDKNGVEIYEGDIYKLPFSRREVEVTFSDGSFMCSESGHRYSEGGEVIGNIHTKGEG